MFSSNKLLVFCMQKKPLKTKAKAKLVIRKQPPTPPSPAEGRRGVIVKGVLIMCEQGLF